MRILIDGHNAMGALHIAGKTHEARRHALLHRVRDLTSRALVFFDARQAPRDLLDSWSEKGVDVHYCREREADAAILEMVRDADDTYMVVTNDREVAGRATQLGARAVGVLAFFGQADDDEEELEPGPPRRLPDIHPRLTPKDFGVPAEVDLARDDFDDDEEE